MTQTQKVRGRSTYILEENGFTCVYYHKTCVVKFNREKIFLNSAGFRTYTTKLRINQTANQFGLNFGVFQRKHIWYVCFNFENENGWTGEIDFSDNMILHRKAGSETDNLIIDMIESDRLFK